MRNWILNLMDWAAQLRKGKGLFVESRITGKTLELTKEEIHGLSDMIKEKIPPPKTTDCWLDPPLSDSVWVTVFLKILDSRPELKGPLGFHSCAERSELVQDFKFRWHCRNFGEFWLKIIAIVCDRRYHSHGKLSEVAYDKLADIIHPTGRRHSYGIGGVTFDAHCWLLFKSALLDSFLDSEESCKSKIATSKSNVFKNATNPKWRAWSKLLSFVLTEMRKVPAAVLLPLNTVLRKLKKRREKMYFWIVSWIATILQVAFFTLGLAAALYYVAELVEEYTSTAAKVIRTLILVIIGVHVGFLLFEDLPMSLTVVGIVSQIVHLALMNSFPVFEPLSPSFIAALVLLVLHHYWTFEYFGESYHNFSEVMAYFTICLWTVPFAFFVSLSANDQVLPTLSAASPQSYHQQGLNLPEGNDVVSNYFSKGRGQKKKGLLSLFNYAKDTLFPSQQKRFS